MKILKCSEHSRSRSVFPPELLFFSPSNHVNSMYKSGFSVVPSSEFEAAHHHSGQGAQPSRAHCLPFGREERRGGASQGWQEKPLHGGSAGRAGREYLQPLSNRCFYLRRSQQVKRWQTCLATEKVLTKIANHRVNPVGQLSASS